MKIGIGLPNPVPGTPGILLTQWARRAEDRGFSGLSTIDRIAYPSYDSLTSLAAAAGATERVELVTNILLAPVYPPVLLAKCAASIDQISAGRLTLGLAPGGRADDFACTGRDFSTRGRDFDAALDLMHRAWRGEPVGGSPKPVCPTPVREGRIPILIGGSSDHAVRRTAEWGVGWAVGGAPPEMAASFAERVRAAWAAAGRSGEPRLAALAYYSLGEDAENDSRGYLGDYYGFLGEYADQIVASAAKEEDAVKGYLSGFEAAGVDEVICFPTSTDPEQVDLLARAAR
jgi:alkanesulfonate monooxygenase SsuD/methylene tetrahydromethanopterin reductase-like flavin-dependent oxidoreductase (luciferase family)